VTTTRRASAGKPADNSRETKRREHKRNAIESLAFPSFRLVRGRRNAAARDAVV
jgi:hypothetical protein